MFLTFRVNREAFGFSKRHCFPFATHPGCQMVQNREDGLGTHVSVVYTREYVHNVKIIVCINRLWNE